MAANLFELEDTDFRSIPPTRPSLIARARAGDGAALTQLAQWYRAPLLRCVAAKRCANVDAEDVVQEVLKRVLVEREILKRVDLARGRFRNLVLGVAKNVMREWSRKNPGHASLGEGGVEALAREEDREAEFEIGRAKAIIEEAIEALRSKHPAEHFVFELRARRKSYQEIAEIYDGRHQDVPGRERIDRVYIDNKYRRAKELVRQCVIRRLREELETDDEVREEVRRLAPYLAQVFPSPD